MNAIPGWLQIVIGVSNAAVLLLLCILMLLAIPAALALRRVASDAARRLDMLSERLNTDFVPVLKDASNLVSDLKGIATTVHEDVQSIHQVVTSTAGRLERLGEGVEKRVERLGTLVDVAQDEAEHIVLAAVTAAQGVRGISSIWRRALGSVWPSHSPKESRNGTQRRRHADDEDQRPRVRRRPHASTDLGESFEE